MDQSILQSQEIENEPLNYERYNSTDHVLNFLSRLLI